MFVHSKQRGFSLVELMIVMVIAAVVIGSGFAYLNSESKRLARENAVADGAREIAIISRAVNEFLDTSAETSGLPKDGAPSLLDPTVHLVGLLPENFGAKPPLTGIRNPIGQPYSIWVAKHNGVWKGIITTDGSADVGAAAAANVETTAQAVAAFNRAVMAKSSRSFQSPVGMTIPNAKTVAPMGEKLSTLRLGSWFDSPAIPKFATSSVAAMVNYPELATAIPADAGTSGGSSNGSGDGAAGPGLPYNKGCYLSQGGCSTGYTANYTYRLCDRTGWDYDSNPTHEYVSTALGTMTVTREMLPTAGGVRTGGKSSIFYSPSPGFAWNSKQLAADQWVAVSRMTGSGTSFASSCVVNGTAFPNETFYGWNLKCYANGKSSIDYLGNNCGWFNGTVGSNCQNESIVAIDNATYRNGLTEATRNMYAVAFGDVKNASTDFRPSNVGSDPVVRELAECPNSPGTYPIPVRQRPFFGGTIEYMELYEGKYRETIQVGSETKSAICESIGHLSASKPTAIDLGQAVQNNCPSITNPAGSGTVKPMAFYRIRIREQDKPSLTVCCEN